MAHAADTSDWPETLPELLFGQDHPPVADTVGEELDLSKAGAILEGLGFPGVFGLDSAPVG